MPIFEYQCSDCDTKFEELVFSSNNSVQCPSCKSEKVDKLISSFSASVSGSSATACGKPSGSCGSGFS